MFKHTLISLALVSSSAFAGTELLSNPDLLIGTPANTLQVPRRLASVKNYSNTGTINVGIDPYLGKGLYINLAGPNSSIGGKLSTSGWTIAPRAITTFTVPANCLTQTVSMTMKFSGKDLQTSLGGNAVIANVNGAVFEFPWVDPIVANGSTTQTVSFVTQVAPSVTGVFTLSTKQGIKLNSSGVAYNVSISKVSMTCN